MRIEQLRYLVEVAEAKSMSKAAERLFVSPQAVSKGIRQLEEELDVTLLVRTSTGAELTRVGEMAVLIAEDMLKNEAQLNRVIAANKQYKQEENTVEMHICSTSAIINIILPDIIAGFSHMGLEIIPTIYTVDCLQEVFEHVESGKCDLGLVTYNEEALYRKYASYQNRLRMDLLAWDDQVVVMDARLHRPEQEVLSLEDFGGHYRTMFSMILADEWVKEAGTVHVMRSNDADFHRAMIKKTDAYVLMPRLAYQHFFSGKSYVALPLEGEWPTLLHAAIYRQETMEIFQRFISMLRMGLQ